MTARPSRSATRPRRCRASSPSSTRSTRRRRWTSCCPARRQGRRAPPAAVGGPRSPFELEPPPPAYDRGMASLLIVNPYASGVDEHRVEAVRAELGWPELVLTERRGHATELVRELEPAAEAVYVFSG